MLSRSDKKDYGVFMEAITEEIEKQLDNQLNKKGAFSYRGLHGNVVLDTSVYLYGEINIENQNDINYLNKFKKAILNPYDTGNFYYSTFDYETGDIIYNYERDAFIGTPFVSDHIKWFKYNYCMLGKPKRVIIYKERIPIKFDD